MDSIKNKLLKLIPYGNGKIAAKGGKGDATTIREVIDNIDTIPASTGWQPDKSWWDIEKILDEDTENVGTGGKAIYLLSNADVTTLFPANYFYKLKTSDGSEYAGSGTHTWDASKDKAGVIPTRYVIGYTTDTAKDFGAFAISLSNTMYAYFANCVFSLLKFGGTSTITSNIIMQSFKLKDCTYPNSFVDGRFRGMSSIREIPELDLTNIETNTFNNCVQLQDVVFPNVTQIGANAFINCGLSSLIIPSSVTDCQNAFPNMNSLINLMFMQGSKITASMNVSASIKLNRDSLLSIIEALMDRTSQSTLTLTLGAINIAKLTTEEKQRITNKNWVLA